MREEALKRRLITPLEARVMKAAALGQNDLFETHNRVLESRMSRAVKSQKKRNKYLSEYKDTECLASVIADAMRYNILTELDAGILLSWGFSDDSAPPKIRKAERPADRHEIQKMLEALIAQEQERRRSPDELKSRICPDSSACSITDAFLFYFSVAAVIVVFEVAAAWCRWRFDHQIDDDTMAVSIGIFFSSPWVSQ